MNPDPVKTTKTDDGMGITFNEIRSDEEHEAVVPAETEIVQPHTNKKDSHLTNHDDVFNVKKAYESDGLETGTIVSDHRRHKTSLGENLRAAFKEWWGGTQEAIHNTIEAIPTHEPEEVAVVTKAELRADIVKEAATNANIAPKDDHSAVIEKIRTYKQDVARIRGAAFTIKEPAAPEKAKGSWSHTLYEDSEMAQPVENKIELPPITDLRSSTIAPVISEPVVPPTPKKAPPVPPAPQRSIVPPSPAPIQTLATPIPQPPAVIPPSTKSTTPPDPAHDTSEKEVTPPTRVPTPHTEVTAPEQSPKKTIPPPPASQHKNITVDAFPHTENGTGVKTPFVTHKTFPNKPTNGGIFSSLLKLFTSKSTRPKITPRVIPAPTITKPPLVVQTPKSTRRTEEAEAPVATIAKSVPMPEPVRVVQNEPKVVPVPQSSITQPPRPVVTPPVSQPEKKSIPTDREVPAPIPPAPRVPEPEVLKPTVVKTPIVDTAPPLPTREFRRQTVEEKAVEQKPELAKNVPLPAYVPGPANDTVRHIGRYAILLGIAIFGVTLAVVASLYFNVFTKSEEPLAIPIQIPTFFSTKTQTPVELTGERETFLAAVREKILSGNEITQIYPVLTTVESTRVATTKEVLAFMGVGLDTKTQNALTSTLMIGSVKTDTNEPFIVLQSYNFDVLFSGLMKWERFMYSDLEPLLLKNGSPRAAFADAVRNNASTRILYSTEGTEMLLYSFINQNTVVITTSSDALLKIVTQF